MSDLIRREDAVEALRMTIAQYIPYLIDINESLPLNCEIALCSVPSANSPSAVYEYLKRKIGDIVDSETEFDAWFKRMVWHVEECNRLADKPSAVDLSSVYSTAYKSGYEKGKADRPQGEWIRDDIGTLICSECKRPRRDSRIGHTNFCNSCGAQMKGACND